MGCFVVVFPMRFLSRGLSDTFISFILTFVSQFTRISLNAMSIILRISGHWSLSSRKISIEGSGVGGTFTYCFEKFYSSYWENIHVSFQIAQLTQIQSLRTISRIVKRFSGVVSNMPRISSLALRKTYSPKLT
jgi:hypothetical protein